MCKRKSENNDAQKEGTVSAEMYTDSGRFRKNLQDIFTLRTLKKRVPIVEWLPKYRGDTFVQDVIAGISVGLTAIPQGIAYAGVAGLPLQYGLYSGFMGCFVYLFFGSCKDVTIGPTAILALMTQKYVQGFGPDFAVLLTFLSGCIVFLLGVFHLGFLIEFISMPVTTGFTTAAALTIGFTQMHSLLGFKGKSNTFLEVWINFIKYANTVQLWDSVLGISTIIILLLLRELRKWGSRTNRSDVSTLKNVLLKFNWLVSLSRNAIVVIVGCVIAWGFQQYDLEPFTLTGEVDKGLPEFHLPPFSTTVGNTTYTFLEMVDNLNVSILTISLISVLEAVAIAKAFSNGKMVDATQEMFALGLCNIFGSFFRSMPTTGSFTRTVVNNASGVQTTAGGIFTGIELLPFFGTLIACLLIGLEIGILVGIILNVIIILAIAARPKISIDVVKVHGRDVVTITPSDGLIYCSADHFSRAVMDAIFSKHHKDDNSSMVIVDGRQTKRIDVTAAKSVKVLLEDLKKRDQQVFLWRFVPSVQHVLLGVYPSASELFVQQQELEEIVKYAGDISIASGTLDTTYETEE